MFVYINILGSVQSAITNYGFSLKPLLYAEVKKTRLEWASQRQALSRNADGTYKIHYLTVASERKGGLISLEKSAMLAGVNLTVGLHYTLKNGTSVLTNYIIMIACIT